MGNDPLDEGRFPLYDASGVARRVVEVSLPGGRRRRRQTVSQESRVEGGVRLGLVWPAVEPQISRDVEAEQVERAVLPALVR